MIIKSKLAKYSLITIAVFISFIILSSASFNLLLRSQLSEQSPYKAGDNYALDKALELGKSTSLPIDINGCFVAKSEDLYSFRFNINTDKELIEIALVDNYGFSILPIQAFARFEMQGSLMSFSEGAGSLGLIPASGFVIGKVQQIQGDYDFIAHSNSFTLALKKTTCK